MKRSTLTYYVSLVLRHGPDAIPEELAATRLKLAEALIELEIADTEYHIELGEDKRLHRGIGKSKETKQAKGRKEALEKKIEPLQKITTAEEDKHIQRRFAEASSEDFLYYQNVNNRARRIRALVPSKKGKSDPVTRDKNDAVMWKFPYNNQGAFYRSLLDHYDLIEVGGQPRSERNKLQHNKMRRNHLRVPPEELHWWTPPARRPVGGLGEPTLNNNSKRAKYLSLNLDLEAIENRRESAEDGRGATEDDPSMTHEQRRKNEINMLNRDVLPTSRLASLEERHTRTLSGLWISAAETSDDWLTSYDSLGIVRSSFTRGEPVYQGSDSDDDPETGPSARSGTRAGSKRKASSDSNTRSDDDDFNRWVTKRNRTAAITQGWSVRTEWAEAANGRRQRHVSEGWEPSSPVDSPPVSPIRKKAKDGARLGWDPSDSKHNDELVYDDDDDDGDLFTKSYLEGPIIASGGGEKENNMGEVVGTIDGGEAV